jgi:HK97 family phage major capsid protein
MPNKGEKFEFYEALRRGDPQMRVLEEHEAAEGLPFVPVPVIEEIFSMRSEYSLIDMLGIRRWPTSAPITNVATEATGHAIPAAILEEGAHVANEPAFALTAVTVTKWGSMITCTEELIEDQALFQAWLPRALARQMGLQENVQLYATLAAGGTLGVHLAAANTLTEAQLNTFYTAMPSAWRYSAKVVTCTENMLSMRALLIATPRAFISPPEFATASTTPEPAMWMGLPMYFNTNWPTLAAAGDAVEVITMVAPEAVTFVQRHGIEIHVDPYGLAATGRIRYFGTARWCMIINQAAGVVHLTDHA